jgi:two-component system LytT family response regulator
MLNVIIIDDESDSIGALSSLLVRFTTVPIKILGTASNLDDGIKLINSNHPDLVFLDINMPNASGMEIYKYFSKPQFKVIFVTAYSQFAIEAIKNSASDYLLKPVNFIELNDAIKKVSSELKKEQQHSQIEDYIVKLNTLDIEGKNIIIDIENGFVVENTKNIEYCVADQSYSYIYTNRGNKIIVSKPLKYLEELLPDKQFYRTHKSYLVNIHYIKQFVKADENYVLLKSDIKIPVSVRKSSDFEEIIKKMLQN